MGRLFCPVPWQHLEILPDHEACLCCHLRLPIGNVLKEPPERVWNSARAQELRRSIQDGTFRYCNANTCPELMAHRLRPDAPRRDFPSSLIISPGDAETHAKTEAPPPQRISLASNRACNLACRLCRDQRVGLEAGAAAMNHVAHLRLRPLFRTASRLRLNGAGELFLNEAYKQLLQSLPSRRFPGLRFEILTNGLLLTARRLADWGLSGRLHLLYVSVDAACASTYQATRGGDWDLLMANVTEVARSRAAERLCLAFVVSALNYQDMPAFVALCRRFGAEAVFSRVQDWGHHAPGAFAKLDIADPGHPESDALLRVLRADILAAADVDLGNLSAMRARALGP